MSYASEASYDPEASRQMSPPTSSGKPSSNPSEVSFDPENYRSSSVSQARSKRNLTSLTLVMCAVLYSIITLHVREVVMFRCSRCPILLMWSCYAGRWRGSCIVRL